MIKMIAYGLFAAGGYFKRGWCILDFVLVCLQIFDVLIDFFPDVFQVCCPSAPLSHPHVSLAFVPTTVASPLAASLQLIYAT